MNDREEQAAGSVSPVNRRITWLILGFAFFSLGASVLPLVPGISRFLPFEWLDRRGALSLYAVFLVSYMGLVFPTTLLRTEADGRSGEGRRMCLGWWWVGAFMLAFSGVPLFVLAYIAGVSLQGVFAVLIWAGIFHGIATLWPRLFGYSSRPLLVVANFVVLVTVPCISRFGLLLGDGPSSWSPMSIVVGMTRDFETPELIAPATALTLVYAALWGSSYRRIGGTAAIASVLILGLTATLGFSPAGTPSTASAPTARQITAGHFVAGRAFPVALTASPGETLTIRVGQRDTLRWTAETGGPRTTWVYLTPVSAADDIAVTSADGGEVARFSLKSLPAQQSLVLQLDREAEVGAVPGIVVKLNDHEPFDSALGYDSFGAVLATESSWDKLSPSYRAALENWVVDGGVLHLCAASESTEAGYGRGRIVRTTSSSPAPGFKPATRARSATEANLYSNFALPDWGQVELGGLLLFLSIYHAVFYAIFLLPLVFDAKKALAVYLVSVGFVLSLVVVGSYYTLKEVFLNENQVLQQNLCTWRVQQGGAGNSVHLSQASCFASFNGNAETLSFRRSHAPRLAPPPGGGQGVTLRLSGDSEELLLEDLALDRFAGKQVVKLASSQPLPFTVEASGRRVTLRPRPGVLDSFGLLQAERLVAFYRAGGRLFPAQFQDGAILVGREPEGRVWQGVIPSSLREDNVVPFLRYSLGRHTTREENVLVLVIRGAEGLHSGERYLASRDILQLVLIPIELPAK